jgi:tetratricopeptide (TPR) repeat protein
MANYAANTKLDQLTLVDGPDMAAQSPAPAPGPENPAMTLELAPAAPTPAVAPAPVAAAPSPAPVAPERPLTLMGKGDDDFMAAAVREFDKGRVEQLLWVRSLAQANGDVAAAKPAYLRARAVALRLERRDKLGEAAPRRDSARGANAGSGGRTPSSARSGKASQAPGTLDHKRIALAAGGVIAVAIVVAFLVMRPGTTPPPAPAVTGAVVPSATSGPAPRTAPEKKADANKGAGMAGEDFARKIQEFKDAGNWNVLVLYAVEWTRKEPANPDAWKELGGGYLRMRQYDDALEATRKAVQMIPNDAQLWQNLGQINVALRQPAAALTAFEKASELNERDVTSRVQTGTLNVELGHLPQARAAFASALAINPLDIEALCGSATVARKEGRTKDAETVVRQLKSTGAECREPEAPSPAPVTATSAPASKKPAPARGR